MDREAERYGGILLAGGKSRRMGREKGLVEIHGRPMYQYPLEVLKAHCDEILISTCRSESLKTGYREICDEVQGVGPLGGIYSCLKESGQDWNLVLSYDMPLVPEELFSFLLSKREDYDLIWPQSRDGQPEPLCGLYRKNLVPLIEHMIRKKEYAVHMLLDRSRSRLVEINESLDFYRAGVFLNINTETDLKQLPREQLKNT